MSYINTRDPFHGAERPAYKTFIKLEKWHPRIPTGQLPPFLHDYCCVHFIGGERESQSLFSCVHKLYHDMFNDPSDRKSMVYQVKTGETIALLTKDRSEAVSSLTFVEVSGSVVILWFGTKPNYQGIGMATFLLTVLYGVVSSRVMKDVLVDVYLKANRAANSAAWTFYERRGFVEMSKSKAGFPPALFRYFGNQPSALSEYLAPSKDLVWVWKQFTKEDLNKILEKNDDGTIKPLNKRLITNPTSNDSPSVYAILPGNMTIAEAEHCHPSYESKCSTLADRLWYPPHADDELGNETLTGTTVALNWITRCFTPREEGFLDSQYLGIVLAWIQRHPKAKVWEDTVTIVPPVIMESVSKMLKLFQEFEKSRDAEVAAYCAVNDSSTALAGASVDTSHLFHPEFDERSFMVASIPVVKFILDNKHVLQKTRYIAMLAQDDTDYSWSCFISINAQRIGRKKENKEESTINNECGYILFDSTLTATDSRKPIQQTFFLRLLYMILYEPLKPRKEEPVPPWQNAVTAPWFQCMFEFRVRLGKRRKDKPKYNFGFCINNSEDIEDDTTMGRLLEFKLDKKYFLLRKTAPVTKPAIEKAKHESALMALIFFLDFFISASNNDLLYRSDEEKGEPFITGLGSTLPLTKKSLAAYIKETQVRIIQVIDRISSTQLGPLRNETTEYKDYLLPEDDGEFKFPTPKAIFRDLASLDGWSAKEKRKENTNDANDAVNEDDMGGIVVEEGAEERQANINAAKIDRKWNKKKPRSKRNEDGVMTPQSKKSSIPKPEDLSGTKPTPIKLSQSLNLPSMADIAPGVNLFAEQFGRAISEESKDDVIWEAFKVVQHQFNMPFVSHLKTMIRLTLEKPKVSNVAGDVGELENVHVVDDVRDLDVGRPTKCEAYMDLTLKWLGEYKAAASRDKNELVKKYYNRLLVAGCRFVEKKDGSENTWQLMTAERGEDVVRRRMRYIAVDKDTKPVARKVAQEPPQNPLGPTPPAITEIVLGKKDEPKRHPANSAFRNKLSEHAEDFVKGDEAEKKSITSLIVDNLQKEGFTFVTNEDGIWKEVKLNDILTKVRKILREKRKNRNQAAKRKAVAMMSSTAADEEGTSGEGGDNKRPATKNITRENETTINVIDDEHKENA